MTESMDEVMHPGCESNEVAGFPHGPAGWSRASAEQTARNENLELSEDHWELVRALQLYFARHDVNDISLRELHDALDEKFHSKGGIKHLYRILPDGPVAQGCRIAGLNPPASAVDKGFGSVV